MVQSSLPLVLAILIGCAGNAVTSRPEATPEIGTVLRSMREQYARVRDGHGKAWMEYQYATRDGGLRVLSKRDVRIAFDEGSAQVGYRETVHLEDREEPVVHTKTEYFVDRWRQRAGLDTCSISASPGGSEPSKEALDAHPLHHMGLLPKGALALLGEAEDRSELEIVGRDSVGGRACLVLEGTMVVQGGATYPIKFWLDSERGFLPVKIHSSLPEHGLDCTARFEYREHAPEVWVLSRGLSTLTTVGRVIAQKEIVYAPDFAVNTGPSATLPDPGTLFFSDDMWEK